MTKKQEIWLFILFPVLLTAFGTFMTYPNIWPAIFSFAIPALVFGYVVFRIITSWKEICHYDWQSLGERIVKIGLAILGLLLFLDFLASLSRFGGVISLIVLLWFVSILERAIREQRNPKPPQTIGQCPDANDDIYK